MLILFDHGTPWGISRALQGHIVKEARAQGWDTLSNGDLLKLGARCFSRPTQICLTNKI
jgi:hypothetical protein